MIKGTHVPSTGPEPYLGFSPKQQQANSPLSNYRREHLFPVLCLCRDLQVVTSNLTMSFLTRVGGLFLSSVILDTARWFLFFVQDSSRCDLLLQHGILIFTALHSEQIYQQFNSYLQARWTTSVWEATRGINIFANKAHLCCSLYDLCKQGLTKICM